MEQLHVHSNNNLLHAEDSEPMSTPNTISKPRELMLHGLLADTAAQNPNSKANSIDITHLSNALRRTAISSNGEHKPYQKLSPNIIDPELEYWAIVFNATRGEEMGNPFQGIDFNKGTNREIYGVRQRILEKKGSTEERIKIQQGFKGFSLWSQVKPFEMDPAELKEVFDMVFVGDGFEGWSRVPGSWWAARKSFWFRGDRGVPFLDTTLSETADLLDNLVNWNLVGNEPENDLKRKKALRVSPPRRRLRDFHPSWRKSEKVMSYEWRMRRRSQEKKAGRWTDGTLRMDRMWEDFHWVLDNDETERYSWRNHRSVWENTWGLRKRARNARIDHEPV